MWSSYFFKQPIATVHTGSHNDTFGLWHFEIIWRTSDADSVTKTTLFWDLHWCVLMCFDVFWCVLMCFDVRCIDASLCSAPQELQAAHAFLMGVLQATDQTVEEDFKVAQFLASESMSYSLSYPVVGRELRRHGYPYSLWNGEPLKSNELSRVSQSDHSVLCRCSLNTQLHVVRRIQWEKCMNTSSI